MTSRKNTLHSITRIIRPSSGEFKKSAAGGKACVMSTINGDSNVPFYKEFANPGV